MLRKLLSLFTLTFCFAPIAVAKDSVDLSILNRSCTREFSEDHVKLNECLYEQHKAQLQLQQSASSTPAVQQNQGPAFPACSRAGDRKKTAQCLAIEGEILRGKKPFSAITDFLSGSSSSSKSSASSASSGAPRSCSAEKNAHNRALCRAMQRKAHGQ